ncbi:hypothetical protein B0H13DRAFT_2336638 [Mycena leptocephala]|nr:hypothetical protein B0H13DRAFT_2336638 [Mycena leptocephala]
MLVFNTSPLQVFLERWSRASRNPPLRRILQRHPLRVSISPPRPVDTTRRSTPATFPLGAIDIFAVLPIAANAARANNVQIGIGVGQALLIPRLQKARAHLPRASATPSVLLAHSLRHTTAIRASPDAPVWRQTTAIEEKAYTWCTMCVASLLFSTLSVHPPSVVGGAPSSCGPIGIAAAPLHNADTCIITRRRASQAPLNAPDVKGTYLTWTPPIRSSPPSFTLPRRTKLDGTTRPPSLGDSPRMFN